MHSASALNIFIFGIVALYFYPKTYMSYGEFGNIR